MSDAQLPVQAGIYTTLTNDVPLMALITGVYDIVPKEQLFPFITIGDVTQTDDSTKGVAGMDLTVTIHTWDQSDSRYRLKQIMGEVYRILHDTSYVVAGMNLINSRFEFSDVFKDPDGITTHGVQRFKIIVDA